MCLIGKTQLLCMQCRGIVPHLVARGKSRGEHFHRKEKKLGRSVIKQKRSKDFYWLNSFLERNVFILLLGSTIIAGYKSSPSGLSTVFN